MDLTRNDRTRQENLQDRLRYYVLQGEYLRKLQEMYKESNIINQNLQLSFQQYRKNRYSTGQDVDDKAIILERISFLQKQLREVHQDISNTLAQLEKLENRSSQ